MPEFFTHLAASEENDSEMITYLSAEKILQFYQKTQQTHLIPEFSRSKQDIVRHLQVFIFDTPTAAKELSFLKHGQKYQVMTSEAQDSVFAVMSTQSQDADVTDKQLTKLVKMVLE